MTRQPLESLSSSAKNASAESNVRTGQLYDVNSRLSDCLMLASSSTT